MQMNQIIRQKRLAKGWTQNDLGQKLGVSGSAVHKWEKNAAYPDITLLPILARALGTDLNTLLQFQKELTLEEVGEFTNELTQILMQQGILAAYSLAKEKLQTFPNSEELYLNTSLSFIAMANFSAVEDPKQREILKEMLDNLRNLTKSSKIGIASTAIQQLFYYHIKNEELSEAENLLYRLPEKNVDKDWLEITLLRKRDQNSEARKLTETLLLTRASNLLGLLDTLAAISQKISPNSEAVKAYQLKIKELAEILEIPDGYTVAADLEAGISAQNVELTLQALNALKKQFIGEPWRPDQTDLYQHLTPKAQRQPEISANQATEVNFMQFVIKKCFDSETGELDFLKENPQFQSFLQELS